MGDRIIASIIIVFFGYWVIRWLGMDLLAIVLHRLFLYLTTMPPMR